MGIPSENADHDYADDDLWRSYTHPLTYDAFHCFLILHSYLPSVFDPSALKVLYNNTRRLRDDMLSSKLHVVRLLTRQCTNSALTPPFVALLSFSIYCPTACSFGDRDGRLTKDELGGRLYHRCVACFLRLVLAPIPLSHAVATTRLASSYLQTLLHLRLDAIYLS